MLSLTAETTFEGKKLLSATAATTLESKKLLSAVGESIKMTINPVSAMTEITKTDAMKIDETRLILSNLRNFS